MASSLSDKTQHADVILGPTGPHPSMIEIIETGMVVVEPKNINVAFGLVDGEKLYECPYNPSHQILYPKWVTHLCRCRKNGLSKFKGPEEAFPIKICPFDPSLHHVPADVFELHAQFCPSRPKMEKIISNFTELNKATAELDIKEVNDENANPEPEDNSWETEAMAKPGSSNAWSFKPPSYRPPPLATKAEKKKYYAEAKTRAAEEHDTKFADQESDDSSDAFSDSDSDAESQFDLRRDDSDSD